MRILVLVTDAYGRLGGIAKFNRDLLSALCKHPRITEVVAIPRNPSLTAGAFPDKLTYNSDGTRSKLNYIATTFKMLRKNPCFDLMIIGHLNLLPLVHLARMPAHTPILQILHGIEAWHPRNQIFRGAFKKITAFFSVSELTKGRFCGWSLVPADKVYLLPNSVDLNRFKPGPRNEALMKEYALFQRKVLMTLGRMEATERAKGFDEVLQVLPELSQRIPDLRYLIVGGGTDKSRLEAKAIALGVAERVVFAGEIPEHQKEDFYRLVDAYVMPSRGEGFGIAFLEAMACGVPIVASKIDGGCEAVRDNTWGVLVDPENPEEVKSGIIEALNRPKGLRPEGLDYFSYQNFERRVHDLVNSVT